MTFFAAFLLGAPGVRERGGASTVPPHPHVHRYLGHPHEAQAEEDQGAGENDNDSIRGTLWSGLADEDTAEVSSKAKGVTQDEN